MPGQQRVGIEGFEVMASAMKNQVALIVPYCKINVAVHIEV